MGEPTAFDSLVASISRQIDTVLSAPVPFLVILAILSVVMWRLLNHHYSGRLETKDGQIALLNERIADYETKLSGASPDEAKARIEALEAKLARLDALEAKVAPLEPRRLTEGQSNKLFSALIRANVRGSLAVQCDMGSPDARALGADFMNCFDKAGWTITSSSTFGASKAVRNGIAIEVHSLESLTSAEGAAVAALNDAGIEFELRKGENFDFYNVDAGLIITHKAL